MESRSAAQSRTRLRPAPRGSGSYQRKRAVTACQVCRARRTKCDNLKPSCSFCLKVGATCIQSEAGLSTFDPASIKILERLEVLETLMRQNQHQHRHPPLESRGDQGPGGSAAGGDDDLDDGFAMDPEPPGDLNSLPVSPIDPESSGLLQPSTLDQIMTWSCFQGVFAGHDLEEEPCSPSSAQSGKTGRDTLAHSTALIATDLEPIRVRTMVDQFFRHVHIKNPIFDERSMRTVVDLTTVNGLDWSPQSCLSLLICAVGTVATPFEPWNSSNSGPDRPTHARAYSYFLAAERRLGPLLASHDVTAAQCLFLAGVFMMYVLEPVRAWRFFLQALAHCQQLKLHSPVARRRRHHERAVDDPEPEDEFDSPHQVLYWSTWKSERDMRRFLRMPDFGPEDRHMSSLYLTFLPTPPPPRGYYGDVSEPSPMGGSSQDRDHDDEESEQMAWYFYLAEISLRRLNARLEADIRTLHQRHASSAEAFLAAAAAVVPSYEAQVQAWIASLPSSLSFSDPPEQDGVCRFSLRGIMVGLMERIYWPFMAAFLNGSADALHHAALQPYAELAQKGLDHQQLKIAINRPGFRHRHQGTYAMVHSCARGALVLIAASRQSRQPLRMPPRWEHDVGDVTRMLEFWGAESSIFERARGILDKASVWAIGDGELESFRVIQ